MKTRSTLALIPIILFTTACTWVNENAAGRSIIITMIDDVKHCKKVGNISAKVKHKIGFIPRNKDKVLRELQTLARNEAVKLNADTIVADGQAIEGKQSYQAFACPQ